MNIWQTCLQSSRHQLVNDLFDVQELWAGKQWKQGDREGDREAQLFKILFGRIGDCVEGWLLVKVFCIN